MYHTSCVKVLQERMYMINTPNVQVGATLVVHLLH